MILTLLNCAIGILYLALMAVVVWVALRQSGSELPTRIENEVRYEMDRQQWVTVWRRKWEQSPND